MLSTQSNLKLLKPRDCRHEPYYPGYATVMFVAGNNDLVCHLPMDRCKQEGPHDVSDCLEFDHGMKLITEDGCLVTTGTLLYYVNYLGKVVPVTLGVKTKRTVRYFKEKSGYTRKAKIETNITHGDTQKEPKNQIS